jgi:DNA-binding PadR family transcriptional regulator
MMTDSELTILSLVSEKPSMGHEIQQSIDERGLREWLTIGFSSVYYILNKLEKQNLISSVLRQERRGPARKIYTISEAGRGVLQTAVSHLLSQPRSLGSGFELGLANLHALKPHQVYRELSYHRDDLKYQLALVEKSWERRQSDEAESLAEHISALYTHSIAIMRAEIEWLEQFIVDWKARYPDMEQSNRSPNHHVAQAKVTRMGEPTTINRAKMLQKLKRPKQEPKDDTQ